jgi:hypothetical protein
MAHAVAAVVTSFNSTLVELVIALHVPRGAISVIALLLAVPDARCPPRATAYTCEVDAGQVYPEGTLKFPLLSVVSGELRRALPADPEPVVPAA